MRRTTAIFAATFAAVCALACGDDSSGGASDAAEPATLPAEGDASLGDEGAVSGNPPAAETSPGDVGTEADGGGAEAGEAPVASGRVEEGDTEGTPASDDQRDADGRPLAPEGYGEFSFAKPLPDAAALTHIARAGYGVVAIYSEPRMDSPKVGFLRLGMTTKAGDKIAADDCRKGWYPLEVGGFACASKGLMVERTRAPFMMEAPDPPDKEAAFPYKWAYVKRWNSPMWWRPPTGAERVLAGIVRAQRESERTGEPIPEPEPAKPKPKPKPKPAPAKPVAVGDTGAANSGDPPAAPDLAALPTLDGPPPEAPPPEAKSDPPSDPPPAVEDPQPASAEDPQPASAEDPKPADDSGSGSSGSSGAEDSGDEEDVGPTEEDFAALPLSPDNPWLEKGYFLSVDRKVRAHGKTYWHTSRGGYVAAEDAYEYKPKDFEGEVLGGDVSFPIGWVKAKSTGVFALKGESKVQLVGRAERRDFFDFAEEIEIRGRAYMRTKDDKLIKKEDLVMPDPRPIPKGLDPWERWVDVDLEKQVLVGYEGDYPAFATLVSTGKKGNEDESFETPVGRWRIVSKQITSNMDGSTATDGNYAIQDVPWVMYFEGSYALHGAFWHRSFGYTRSHGCVNLGPSDARFLFNWTTPFVPEGWHGAHSGDENPGTTVVIRRGG